ncbi:MAG TPA: response regulator transcription factor [Bacteroidia bacterium]|jgi:two-component system alkaline phosphatase synthesis response regulator PhoP|nr:response regulator transcription factor [Bacteroidia bacterium]HRG53033.1 response regulator transcription factor [Bacteroidia bacterium]
MDTITSKNKILLVDDEADILEFLSYNLKKEGYHVFTANNGKEAVTVAKKENPDVIILDVMMPDMDGIETCREIRDLPGLKDVMIAFLTARNEDYSQIAGFEVGADDYINKPIKPRVLISRIKALLRRSGAGETNNVEKVEMGGIKIDRERYLIVQDGNEINLPKKEFELLALLASKPGKVFTRESILDKVWGGEVVVGDRTIDVHIRKLREKLGEDFIRTVKGIGYKFEF